MDRILIVDGHNLLFQMFFGMPNVIINKDGKMIQGTLGFVGALLKIIDMVSPTHILVLFDSEKREVRSDIYSDYKANRIDFSDVKEEDNPFSQLNDIYKALDYLKIRHTEVVKYEVDDVIATYCLKYGNFNEIFISSFDSDFFQLISKNVKVLRYRGKNTIICDENYLKEKYEITPNMYAAFKSLVGDSADNIKGICKIGPKTASKLLNEYENLQNLIANIENIEKLHIKNALINGLEDLKRNYKLVKLTDEAPIPYEKELLKYSKSSLRTNDVLIGIGVK